MPFLVGYIAPQDYGAAGDGVTNDTAAFQNALTAAAGSTLFVPEGTYLLTSTLTIPANTSILGANSGGCVIHQSTASTACLTATSVSNVNVSNVTLQGTNDGTGTGLTFTSVINGSIDNVTTTQTGTGFSLTTCTSVNLDGCETNADTNGVLVSGGTGNSVISMLVNGNKGVGLHATGTAINVTVIAAAERSPNGATSFITVDSGSAAVLVDCFAVTASSLATGTTMVVPGSADTLQVPVAAAFNGGVTTAASIDSTRAAAANSSFTAKVTGDSVARYNLEANGVQEYGSGAATRDIVTGRAAANIWYVSKNLLVGSATALGDNGVGEVQLANATTPPTTNPTGGVVHYGANGTSTLQRDTAGHLTNLSWSDEYFQMNGFTVRNMDPNFANSNNLCTTTVINLHKIYVPTTVTTTTVFLYVSVIGATLTSGQNLVGLYNAAGTRVAVTADQSAAWVSTGLKSIAWSSSFAIPSPGIYYVAILSNGTTPATFAGSGGFSGMYNANVTGATLVHAETASGQTSMPSSITMSSNVSSAKSIFVAIV